MNPRSKALLLGVGALVVVAALTYVLFVPAENAPADPGDSAFPTDTAPAPAPTAPTSFPDVDVRVDHDFSEDPASVTFEIPEGAPLLDVSLSFHDIVAAPEDLRITVKDPVGNAVFETCRAANTVSFPPTDPEALHREALRFVAGTWSVEFAGRGTGGGRLVVAPHEGNDVVNTGGAEC